MSHIPSSAMKHAHTAPAEHHEPAAAKPARRTADHLPPPIWTSVAAGVAGAVATALLLSLRSSSPAPKGKGGKRGKGARKTDKH